MRTTLAKLLLNLLKLKWPVWINVTTNFTKHKEGKKADEIPQAEKDELSDVEKKLADEKTKKEAVLGEYAGGNKVIRQLIDLALLQNNMLKGEALTNFVKRSIELI